MKDEKFIKRVQKSSQNQEALSLMFIGACLDGDLDKVRYLLTSPDLKEHAKVSHNKYQGFLEACERGYFEIVRYLLSSPEINEHADINANEGQALAIAIGYDHREIMEYLLFSSDLKEHADIRCDNFYSIYSSCFEGNIDLV
jgi:ankyrin repeat protein